MTSTAARCRHIVTAERNILRSLSYIKASDMWIIVDAPIVRIDLTPVHVERIVIHASDGVDEYAGLALVSTLKCR